MSLLDKLRGEFIDIIEWTEPSNNDILCYRFPRYQNEIKNGAKLTVREGQAAVFVSEGQIADVFTPGMYTLETKNLPILSTIKGWKYGFNSPFKAEVYFVSTRQWTDKKWGTQNPVMMRDPEFGPVRVRAFGSYAFRVGDPATFMRQLVATDPSFETYEIANQLRNVIVSRIVDAMGQSKMPILDLAGNYEKLSQLAKDKVAPEMAGMGLTITQFLVENISLPPEVEQMLDKRSSMAVLGNLDQYTRSKPRRRLATRQTIRAGSPASARDLAPASRLVDKWRTRCVVLKAPRRADRRRCPGQQRNFSLASMAPRSVPSIRRLWPQKSAPAKSRGKHWCGRLAWRAGWPPIACLTCNPCSPACRRRCRLHDVCGDSTCEALVHSLWSPSYPVLDSARNRRRRSQLLRLRPCSSSRIQRASTSTFALPNSRSTPRRKPCPNRSS